MAPLFGALTDKKHLKTGTILLPSCGSINQIKSVNQPLNHT
jgi:hypothetical protein